MGALRLKARCGIWIKIGVTIEPVAIGGRLITFIDKV